MTAAPLLAYYGDDLTGSTDVMEALELRGVPAVLFTGIPTAAQAAGFSGRGAVGIAGTSRSQSPAWMDTNLPPVFEWMKGLGAAVCHYKICSTFDSSPAIGSIGRALDIGAGIFGQASTPLVVGAPELKRYTAFGNLFAAYRGRNFRIDRHPVMSRHPMTPMDEGDLRLHLARQTHKSIGLVDVVSLKGTASDEQVDAVFDAHEVVLLDVIDEETKAEVGRHLWRRREKSPFVVGSSGVEYALTATASGTPVSVRKKEFPPPGSRGPVAVVSGSCSPTTERQIGYALDNGFDGVSVDAVRLTSADVESEVEGAIRRGSRALASGRSPILYTALGPASDLGAAVAGGGHLIGRALGRILAALVERHGLGRAIVAGGDTSSHAMAELGIYALECLMPLPQSSGSPLCKAFRSAGSGPLDIAFKGGQVGLDDYFVLARDI